MNIPPQNVPIGACPNCHGPLSYTSEKDLRTNQTSVLHLIVGVSVVFLGLILSAITCMFALLIPVGIAFMLSTPRETITRPFCQRCGWH